MAVNTRNRDEEKYLDWVRTQVMEELNVKDLVPFTQIAGLMDKVKSESDEGVDAHVKVDSFSVVIEAGYMVALDGELSDELIEEGLARELAHRVQTMRKDSNFDLTDRIVIYYEGPDKVRTVMSNYSEYISQETLSDDLVYGLPDDKTDAAKYTIDGLEISIMVKRS
jgi:isoleucyl-tRNA synthetase